MTNQNKDIFGRPIATDREIKKSLKELATNQNNTSVEETPPLDGHIHKCVECSLNFYDKPITNQNNELYELLNEYLTDTESDLEAKTAFTINSIQALYAPKPVENGELRCIMGLCDHYGADNNHCWYNDTWDRIYTLNGLDFDSTSNEMEKAKFEAVEAYLAQEKAKWVAKVAGLYGTPTCNNLHHPKKYQHSAFEDCPVEQALAKLLDKEK